MKHYFECRVDFTQWALPLCICIEAFGGVDWYAHLQIGPVVFSLSKA